jgi:hypothetical protein
MQGFGVGNIQLKVGFGWIKSRYIIARLGHIVSEGGVFWAQPLHPQDILSRMVWHRRQFFWRFFPSLY